jgi:hypothetical protein
MTGDLVDPAAPVPAEEPPILQVRDLRTHFKTLDGVVKAVDGVDFEVPRGGRLAIVDKRRPKPNGRRSSGCRLIPHHENHV